MDGCLFWFVLSSLSAPASGPAAPHEGQEPAAVLVLAGASGTAAAVYRVLGETA